MYHFLTKRFILDQQQKDSYKETPEPAFAGTGVSLSTDLFYSPCAFSEGSCREHISELT